MKMREVIIFLILMLEIIFGVALCIRTGISNYDIKADHVLMETNYCPYCGEKLSKE